MSPAPALRAALSLSVVTDLLSPALRRRALSIATAHSKSSILVSLMNNSPKIEDIFESSLHLEDTCYQQGHGDGYKDGLVSGKQEGSEVGLKVGFQVGEELGFYRGCVDVWNSVIRIDSAYFSLRTQKRVKQMDDLIKSYPVLDPENESVQEILDALRLKFRAITATMGVKFEYVGYPKSSEEGNIDF